MKSTLFELSALMGFCIPLVASVLFVRWSVPTLFCVLPILYAYSNADHLLVRTYPLTYLSATIWSMFGVFVAKGSLFKLHLKQNRREFWLLLLWGCFLGATALGLIANLEKSSDPLLLLSCFITGVAEPFLLYIVCRAWLQKYPNSSFYVWSMFLCVFSGVLLSFTIRTTAGYDFSLTRENIDSLRLNAFSFGNANLYGMVLVLSYPLALSVSDCKGIFKIPLRLGVPAFFGFVALFTFSRGTIAVLLLESFIWVLTRERIFKKMQYLLLSLAIVVMMFISSPRATDFLLGRFAESDLTALVFRTSGVVSENDRGREEAWNYALRFLRDNPTGGEGALADAENLFLTTAMKFGWLSLLSLAALIALPSCFLLRTKTTTKRERLLKIGVLCSLAGFFLYCATTGSDLSHLTANEDGFVPQNVGGIFLAATLALVPTLEPRMDFVAQGRKRGVAESLTRSIENSLKPANGSPHSTSLCLDDLRSPLDL